VPSAKLVFTPLFSAATLKHEISATRARAHPLALKTRFIASVA
jgi:hypothetical protein